MFKVLIKVNKYLQGANSLGENKFRKIASFVKKIYVKILENEIPALGAQLTYYYLLSFFPFLIFLLTLLSYTKITDGNILKNYSHLIPNSAYNIIMDIIDQAAKARSETLLSFSMLATIWAASIGVSAITRGMNKAYRQKESRSFWKVKGLALLFTLLIALVLVLTLVMLVLGETLGNYLFSQLGISRFFSYTWQVARHVVPLLAMFFLLLNINRYIPDYKLSFKDVVPGVAVSTAGWIILSLVFSYYVNNYAQYPKTYGHIGGVIALLIWLYWSNVVILVGGEINAAILLKRRGNLDNK